MEGWGFGGAEIFTDEVKWPRAMDRDCGGLRWRILVKVADCDASAAGGVKECGVGRGIKGAGDIGGEGSVFEVRDGRDGGVDGEGRAKWGRSVYVGKVGTSVRGIRGLRGGRG